MAAARLLRMSRPLGFAVETDSSSRRRPTTLRAGLGLGERKTAAVKAATVFTDKGADLVHYAARALSRWREERSSGLQIQMLMEKAIIDCRFLTLLAVGGSLLCSVPCFLEGCMLVMGSYLQNFHALPDRGQMVLQLIEAIDMFIMGTAMTVFGSALYVMYVAGEERNLNVEKLPSAMEAKSKIGHAVMLILQVQVLEKFKSIAVRSGMDLACFAGAIFLCSAATFVLSRT